MNKYQKQQQPLTKKPPINPSLKHQKLIKILSKNRSISLDYQNKSQQNSGHECIPKYKDQKSSREILKIVRERLSDLQIQENKMNKTNFMINYMDKLKKQRKRQQKKKLKSFINKQEMNTTKVNSVYIFLPNVIKEVQKQDINPNTYTNVNLKSKQIDNENYIDKDQQKGLKTINLFESRNFFFSKSHKKRAYSFDQKNRFIPKKAQKQIYQKKVNEIIQQIKTNRTKPNKYLSVVNSKTNQTFYFQNNINYQPKTDKKLEQIAKILPQIKIPQKIKQQKTIIRHKKTPNIENRQLEPWTYQKQQIDFHPIYYNNEDEDFRFY